MKLSILPHSMQRYKKKLLNEFEIPYALLDYTGKILWVNERFSELTGVGRNYHKSITTLFSNITREFLQKHEDAQDITIEKKGAHFPDFPESYLF